MYILAFILLIISIAKILMLVTTNKKEIANNFSEVDYSLIQIIILVYLADSILGLMCSLFILLV